ncbi:MAG: heavy-metal-associated domain-containing protein [Gemmatimonadales bacterium]
MAEVTLQIEGMSCSHCLNAVNQALSAIPGATVRTVEMGRAVVDLTGPAGAQQLVAAVSKAGYPATVAQG